MATDSWIELPATTGGSSGVSSLNGLTGSLSLIPGTGISITPSGSTIVIANTEAGGTVTSVALTLPSGVFSVSGSPVTTSGTLSGSFVSQSANTFFSAPSGSSGTPSFRSIVSADIPTLNQNTTGTASNITATSNSTLVTLSSLSLPYSQVVCTTRTITSNLVVDTTIIDYIIFCNNTTGITITLPAPTNGRILIIKDINGNSNTNNITVIPHASESIEGLSSSYILQTNYGSIQLISDGTNWWIT